MSEAMQALMAYQQADEDGVMVLTSRQAIHEVAERYETLRRTLEQHAVRLMGPHSPFWQCSYCQALSQTPIAFKHKPECIMAGAPLSRPQREAGTTEIPSQQGNCK